MLHRLALQVLDHVFSRRQACLTQLDTAAFSAALNADQVLSQGPNCRILVHLDKVVSVEEDTPLHFLFWWLRAFTQGFVDSF